MTNFIRSLLLSLVSVVNDITQTTYTSGQVDSQDDSDCYMTSFYQLNSKLTIIKHTNVHVQGSDDVYLNVTENVFGAI